MVGLFEGLRSFIGYSHWVLMIFFEGVHVSSSFFKAIYAAQEGLLGHGAPGRTGGRGGMTRVSVVHPSSK